MFKVIMIAWLMLLSGAVALAQSPAASEKSKVVPATPATPAAVSNPAGGATGTVSGKQAAPNLTAEEKKARLVEQNRTNPPAVNFQPPSPQAVAPVQQSTKAVNKVVVFPQEPTYPVYMDTGNPEADQERFAKEKDAWIAKNPEKYRQLTQPGTPPAAPKQ